MQEARAFGRWIKRLRRELDLTQDALAERVGCATQTVRAFESGSRRPSRDLAERMAVVLQVPEEQQPDFVRLARMPGESLPARPERVDQVSLRPEDEVAQATDATSSGKNEGGADTSDGQVGLRQTPILTTKLYMPRPRAELVRRPRLLARLDAGLVGRLTVIAAPAGFGKTTLLADWLQQQDEGSRMKDKTASNALHPSSTAWLALDAGDSDPIQFLRYLIAAVRTMAPDAGAKVLTLLESSPAPAIESLAPLLINDLVNLPERSILVLDDYHVIDSLAVHQALAFLLDHLPPQLHLVIATRVDPPLPLARLRARGELTELRVADLRFTTEEAAAFLRDVMDVALTVDDVAALDNRTEGWIAGLQLAALSLRDRPGVQQARFIDAFTGSHRFVVDYLVDEVIARQPSHLQTFLLQTSILERLCGPLCDAVVLGEGQEAMDARRLGADPAPSIGRPSPQAYSQTLLEELERSNLFLVPLDNARRWYRYHHLFAEVLRERLASGASPDAVALLHRRAAAWFEQHGLVVEAVQHALAARDWEHAARLIEARGRTLIVNGHVHVHTVRGWLAALPDAVTPAHPYLYVLDALGLFFANQLDAAELRVNAAEELLASDTQNDRSRGILGYAAIIQAAIAVARGDLARCVRLAQRGIELLPATNVSLRTPARVHLAQAYLLSGDVSPANERLVAANLALVRDSGELSNLFYAVVTLAGIQRRQGRLRQADATYREAGAGIPDPGGIQALPDGANYYFGLGDVLREWNSLDDAEAFLLHGRAMVRAMRLAQAEAVVMGYVALARLQQARGDAAGALVTLAELLEVARQRSFMPHLGARAAAAQAHLALLQGDVEAAVRWVDTSDLRVDDDLSYPREMEYLTLARVCIAQGRRDRAGPYLRDALRLLDRLLANAEAGARMDSVIEILIIRALALQAQGDYNGALANLERALALAAPEGYVRVFVDEGAPMATLLRQGLGVRDWGLGLGGHEPTLRAYAQQLLAIFPEAERTTIAPLAPIPQPLTPDVEPLTEREMEVLRLLVAGRSNQVIAQELVVAVGTVKRHVNSILGKLQVASRLEAVARARDLGIV